MAANRNFKHFGRLLIFCLALSGLLASEHQGLVKSGGIPVPGATVTAVQGDKKFVTTTDDQGAYVFPDLPDGVWTITVEMLGFAKHSEDVGIAPMAPSPVWDLKQLSAADLKAALAAANKPNPPAPVPAATAQNGETKPNTMVASNTQNATAQPAASTSASAAPSSGGGRGTGQGGNRPSLRNSLGQNGQNGGRGGFQQMDLNASALTDGANGLQTDGAEAASPDQAQSANDAFVVGGSISSGVTMPQTNDWFGGRGGMNGMGFGPGGPGMGPGGPNGDGMQVPGAGPQIAGGPGGPGGRGGGGGGFGGGRGGFGGGGLAGAAGARADAAGAGAIPTLSATAGATPACTTTAISPSFTATPTSTRGPIRSPGRPRRSLPLPTRALPG